MRPERSPCRLRFGFRTWALITAIVLVDLSAGAAIISRSITVDGDVSDWAGIVNNPGQFSTDAEGTVDPADLDYLVQATGRDLKLFSYTFDSTSLYFYVERYASQSNKNDWWFYLDTNDSGTLEDGEYIFNVRWQGSNGEIERILWQYDAVNDVSGDPLTIGNPPHADGYDMPGSNVNSFDLDPPSAKITGGTSVGTEMESFLLWSEIGFAGPTSVGFHISSSNGSNLPNQIDDNMDGVAGGALLFTDLSIEKTVDRAFAGSGTTAFFTLTISNLGPEDTTDIVVLDDLVAAGLTYVSDDADGVASTYDALTGEWTVLTLAAGDSVSLTVGASATVSANTDFTNIGTIVGSAVGDTDASNDSDDATIRFGPAPVVTLQKTVSVVEDPISGTTFPKAIPGALLDYTVRVSNSGPAGAASVEILDDLPAEVQLFVGDLSSGSGPVTFTDGTGSDASGLSYQFLTLSDTFDDLAFSADFGVDGFSYVPSPNASGIDPNVTSIRILPGGDLTAGSGSAEPYAEFRFRVRLE